MDLHGSVLHNETVIQFDTTPPWHEMEPLQSFIYNFPKAFRTSHPQPLLRKSCCWRGINRKSYYCTSIWVIRRVSLLKKVGQVKNYKLKSGCRMTMRMQLLANKDIPWCTCKNVSQLLTCVNELGINKQKFIYNTKNDTFSSEFFDVITVIHVEDGWTGGLSWRDVCQHIYVFVRWSQLETL